MTLDSKGPDETIFPVRRLAIFVLSIAMLLMLFNYSGSQERNYTLYEVQEIDYYGWPLPAYRHSKMPLKNLKRMYYDVGPYHFEFDADGWSYKAALVNAGVACIVLFLAAVLYTLVARGVRTSPRMDQGRVKG